VSKKELMEALEELFKNIPQDHQFLMSIAGRIIDKKEKEPNKTFFVIKLGEKDKKKFAEKAETYSSFFRIILRQLNLPVDGILVNEDFSFLYVGFAPTKLLN
jgi:hypothetical protein